MANRCIFQCSKWLAIAIISALYIAGILIFEYVNLYKLAYRKFSWPVGLVGFLGGWVLIPWIFALWSFLACAIVDPGYVPHSWGESFVEDSLPVTEIERKFCPKSAQFCEKCQQHRPERSHHCSFCNRCVLRMDHHCPWVGNCVGVANSRFFVQFTFHSCITCLLALVISIPISVTVLKDKNEELKIEVFWVTAFFVWFLSMIVFGFAAGAVCVVQLQYLVNNSTTLDSDYPKPNPYDIGSRENLRQIFGSFPPAWFLPMRYKHKTLHDGIHYTLRLDNPQKNAFASEVNRSGATVVVPNCLHPKEESVLVASLATTSTTCSFN